MKAHTNAIDRSVSAPTGPAPWSVGAEDPRRDAGYRALFEGSRDAVYFSTRDGRLLEANQAALDLFGYTREEMLELNAADLYASPEHRERLRREVEKTGSVKDHEVTLREKDGTEIDCLLTSTVRRDDEGVVVGYQGIIRDPERKRAEDLLRSLVDAAPLALLVTNEAGTMVVVNSDTAAIFGYDRSELIGQPFEMLIPENVRDRHATHCAHYLADPQAPSMGTCKEFCGRRKDGGTVPLEIGLSPIKTGGETFVAAAIVDITERKRAEDNLHASREQLRNLAARLHAVREEERAAVAREIHDGIGQALTALKMDVAWLGDRLPHDQPSLVDRTHAMNSLIDGTLRDVRQLSARLRPAILDDMGLVAAIEWQAQEFARRTGVKLDMTLEATHGGLDPDRITAIFRILQEALTNVARHAKAGHVEIRFYRRGRNVILEVRDDGQGITDKQRDSAESIGLIGMRERATALDGQLDIRGLDSHGTMVTLSLPITLGNRHHADDPTPRRRRPPHRPRRPEADGRGLR